MRPNETASRSSYVFSPCSYSSSPTCDSRHWSRLPEPASQANDSSPVRLSMIQEYSCQDNQMWVACDVCGKAFCSGYELHFHLGNNHVDYQILLGQISCSCVTSVGKDSRRECWNFGSIIRRITQIRTQWRAFCIAERFPTDYDNSLSLSYFGTIQ